MQLPEYEFTVTSVTSAIERNTTKWNLDVCNKSYTIVLALDGSARYKIKDQGEILTQKNSVYLFSPSTKRTGNNLAGNPWHFISVNFELNVQSGDPDSFNKLLLTTHDVSENVIEMFRELNTIWTEKHAISQTRCCTIVQHIICELILTHYRTDKAAHKKDLSNAKNYIRKHFSQPLMLDDIAKVSGLSSSHFRKLFTAQYGQSPMQYVMYLRINKAKALLSSGECNVSETSHLCGFSDVFYFSRMFKKITGVSPSNFME